jgi:PAS domain S-box-containing protein
MTTEQELERELNYRLAQQGWLSELGLIALQNRDILAVLQDACRLAAAGLGTRFAKVLQFLPAENQFLVLAGVGWKPGVVGVAKIPAGLDSPAGYALHTGEPVVSEDQSRENRFRFPALLIEHGIDRAINVIIRGADHPFGVLEVDSSGDREFSGHDVDFLQSAAHMLAAAIERQRTDEVIREGGERVHLALDTGKLGSWQLEFADRTLSCSNACKADFGRRADEPFTHDDLVKAIHPADRRRLRRALDRAVRKGADYDGEYRVAWPDGSEHSIHVRGRSIRGPDGTLLRMLGVTQDVTHRKRVEKELADHRDRLEQLVAARTIELERSEAERRRTQEAFHQAQKMEVVGQMTGGIAHDFNNLLTVVVANMDLLDDLTTGNERARRLIGNVQHAAARGGQLTSQLLAFARRQTLQPERLDLNRLFDDFAGLMRHASGNAVQVVMHPTAEPAMCDIDRGHFEAALLNLAINARDAMPMGGTLTIDIGEAELDAADAKTNADVVPGPYIHIAVSDTGTGMAPETMERAFEPFFTTKEIGKGTGLGLSQVYGFVKQSGGHVKLHSEAGCGTTVDIYLPRSPDGRPSEAKATPAMPANARGTETILVVEDDDDVLDVATETLTELGYRVLVARDGPEALAILNSDEALDLLFSDVVMPNGMTGVSLARQARRVRPGLKVVLTSGYSPHDLSAQDAPGPEFQLVGKPYRRAQLAEVIRNTLASPLQVAGDHDPAKGAQP